MASKSTSSRKRGRTAEVDGPIAEDANVSAKGGHSLRKKARIHYNTIEVEDDDEFRKEIKAPAPSTRPKRKTAAAAATAIADLESEAFSSAPPAKKQRITKSQEPAPSQPTRRKAQPKKQVNGTKTASAPVDKQNDSIVHDTIEVGVAFAESDDSEEPITNSQSEQSSTGIDGNATHQGDEAVASSASATAPVVKTQGSPLSKVHSPVLTQKAPVAEAPEAASSTVFSKGDRLAEIWLSPTEQAEKDNHQTIDPSPSQSAPVPVASLVDHAANAATDDAHVAESTDATSVLPVWPAPSAPAPKSSPPRVTRINVLRANHVASPAPETSKTTTSPVKVVEKVSSTPVALKPTPSKITKTSQSSRPSTPKLTGARHGLSRRSTAEKDDSLSYLKSAKRTTASKKFASHINFLSNGDDSTPKPQGKWSHLTPFVDSVVYYPEIYDDGDDSEQASRIADDEVPDLTLDQVDMSLAATSAVNTPVAQSPVDSNFPAPDAENVDEAIAAAAAIGKNQVAFRKVRDPKEFLAALKDHKSMTTEDLFALLATTNDAMHAWETEYQKVTRIVEEEDNAVRRAAHDANYEKATALALKNPRMVGKDVVERDFVPKFSQPRESLSTPKAGFKTDIAYLRQQDKIMAQAYGFEYDPRPDMVGRQDPVGQREGIQNTRLRARPKLTQKAAEIEAEESLTGRRIRRAKGTDISPAPSRAGSPALLPAPELESGRRGRRGTRNMDDNYEEMNGDGSPRAASPKKSATGRPIRATAKSKLSTSIAPIGDELLPSTEAPEPVEEPKKTSTRKRARQPAEEEPTPAPAPTKRYKITVVSNGNRSANGHSHAHPAAEPSPVTEDSRPSTADSTKTAETVVSDYSFRPRGQRKVQLKVKQPAAEAPAPIAPAVTKSRSSGGIAGKSLTMPVTRGGPSVAPAPHHQPPPTLMPQPAYPPPGMAPTPPSAFHDMMPVPHNTHQIFPASPFHHAHSHPSMPLQPPLAPAPTLSATVQKPRSQGVFKIKNYNHSGPSAAATAAPPPVHSTPSAAMVNSGGHILPRTSEGPSRQGTPALGSGIVPGENGEEGVEKDYRQMTKSEKMSHSMRTRWANGSMASAVAKRKATLAAKKAQTATTQGSAGGSPVGGSADGTPAPSLPPA